MVKEANKIGKKHGNSRRFVCVSIVPDEQEVEICRRMSKIAARKANTNREFKFAKRRVRRLRMRNNPQALATMQIGRLAGKNAQSISGKQAKYPVRKLNESKYKLVNATIKIHRPTCTRHSSSNDADD